MVHRDMARGPSGRLVFEIDPALKRELHARLARDGRSAKDWLLERIEAYLDAPQLPLPLASDVVATVPRSSASARELPQPVSEGEEHPVGSDSWRAW